MDLRPILNRLRLGDMQFFAQRNLANVAPLSVISSSQGSCFSSPLQIAIEECLKMAPALLRPARAAVNLFSRRVTASPHT